MDNNPKDSSASTPNRDRQRRQHGSSGNQEGGGQPPTEQERPEQHVTGGATAPMQTVPEAPASAQERQRAARGQADVAGGDGSGRVRGAKRSRAGDEGAGSSGAKPRKPQEFDAPDVASPCSVCGRRFGSWKALFGHMRSHPEREWRGIHPPPKFNREGTPPEGADDGQGTDENVKREQGQNLLLGVAHEVAAQLGPGGHTDQAAAPQRRGLGIDLNLPNDQPDVDQPPAPPPPEGKEEGGFDLNRSPPPSGEE